MARKRSKKKKRKPPVQRNVAAEVMAERGIGRQVFKDRREPRGGDKNEQRELREEGEEK